MAITYKITFVLDSGKKDVYVLDESRILSRDVKIEPLPQAQLERMMALVSVMRDWLRDMGGASIEAKTLGKKA